MELGKATLLHPLPVPSRLPGEPGCSSTMHGPATALHIYVCTLEEGLPVLWGCRVLPLLASAPEEGGESALKPPRTHRETPSPLIADTKQPPLCSGVAWGRRGREPGSLSAEMGRATKQWHFSFFPPNQQRLLEDQQQKKKRLENSPHKGKLGVQRLPSLAGPRADASRQARCSKSLERSPELTAGGSAQLSPHHRPY